MNWVSGGHSVTPQQGSVHQIRLGLVQAGDLLIYFSYYLGSYLESFQNPQLCGLFESMRLVAGMWVYSISVAESLLRQSCFSPASYSLVLDYFSCGFGLGVYTLGFHFLYSFPFTQTMKKGIIMRYSCICLHCQVI